MMKVVALSSFYGCGVNAHKGLIIEVADSKLAKEWIKGGLAEAVDDTAEAQAVATTTPSDEAVDIKVDGDSEPEKVEVVVDEKTDGETAEVVEPDNADNNAEAEQPEVDNTNVKDKKGKK